jgi:glucose/arabinose dehydrogenase
MATPISRERCHNRERVRRLWIGLTVLACPVFVPTAHAGGIAVQVVKADLEFPAAFAVAPGGRIVYAERYTGEIRVYNPSTGSDTLFFTVTNVATAGEQGLLGVALHPKLLSGRPFVYAYATRNTESGLQNQILRIRIRAGGNHTSSVIFSSDVTPTGSHNGGVIHFGPDGQLYAQIGDGGLHASHMANAQDLSVRAGKMVRMTANGAVPPDNPFVGMPGHDGYIYSYGFRNGYGFTFDPVTDHPWETQNGPSCNDEVNRLVPGGNYAWGPSQDCLSGTAPENTNRDGPEPRIMPVEWFVDTRALTGIVFCDGCGLIGAEGSLFFGEYNPPYQIRQGVLTQSRQAFAFPPAVVHSHPRGILSMERGPDGTIYFSDANGIHKLVNA